MMLIAVLGAVILDIIGVLLADYFYSQFYTRKYHSIYFKLIVIFVVGLIHYFFFLFQYSFFIDYIVIILESFGFCLERKERIKIIFIISVTNMLVDFMTYNLCLYVFNYRILVTRYVFDNLITYLQMILSKYILFVFLNYMIYKKRIVKDVNAKIFKYTSLGVSLFLGISVLVFYNEILFYYDIIGRLFIFVIILYNVILVVFNHYQNVHTRTINELEVLKENIGYQDEYVRGVVENEGTIRKLKHDLLNQYTGLYGYLEKGNYDKIGDFLSKEIKNLKSMERVTYFGDAYIDSLISHKLYEAKEKGIDIEVSCNIISIGKINPPDLGILIANALDNAIEASEKVEDKKITLKVMMKGSYLHMIFTNYCINKEIDLSKTSKLHDKRNHGYGIKSMKHIVSLYNGRIKFDRKDNLMEVSVILCIA